MKIIHDSWRQEYLNNYYWWGIVDLNDINADKRHLQIYRKIRQELDIAGRIKVILENATQV